MSRNEKTLYNVRNYLEDNSTGAIIEEFEREGDEQTIERTRIKREITGKCCRWNMWPSGLLPPAESLEKLRPEHNQFLVDADIAKKDGRYRFVATLYKCFVSTTSERLLEKIRTGEDADDILTSFRLLSEKLRDEWKAKDDEDDKPEGDESKGDESEHDAQKDAKDAERGP